MLTLASSQIRSQFSTCTFLDTNFARFYLFSVKIPKIQRQLFGGNFPAFFSCISFLEKSQKFSFLGGYICNFFEFSHFLKLFHTNAAGNDPQWQIWPKTWLRLGQNGHFCIFFYLSPQNEAEITRNGQFHLIHNFSHLLPPKHLIFGEISKIFIFGGGVHWQIF